MDEENRRPTASQRTRSREWLSFWMVLASAGIAIAAIPHGSFVPAGLIVLGLVALYAVVFVVRLRRTPKDDNP